jgi:hypothetical protein
MEEPSGGTPTWLLSLNATAREGTGKSGAGLSSNAKRYPFVPGPSLNRCCSIGSALRPPLLIWHNTSKSRLTERLFSWVVIGLWENSTQRDYSDGPWAAYLWSSSRLTP